MHKQRRAGKERRGALVLLGRQRAPARRRGRGGDALGSRAEDLLDYVGAVGGVVQLAPPARLQGQDGRGVGEGSQAHRARRTWRPIV